jgi:hypothetical protein
LFTPSPSPAGLHSLRGRPPIGDINTKLSILRLLIGLFALWRASADITSFTISEGDLPGSLNLIGVTAYWQKNCHFASLWDTNPGRGRRILASENSAANDTTGGREGKISYRHDHACIAADDVVLPECQDRHLIPQRAHNCEE